MLIHLEDFQILCANCNAIKVVENYEANHLIIDDDTVIEV